MTQQFHEGQEVEVADKPLSIAPVCRWRKAEIVGIRQENREHPPVYYTVQFADGTRAIFDAKHIRDPKVGRAMYEHAARLARPTPAEQTHSYRTAMRDAGRGRLLP
jgi:hypothetical protein